MGVLLIFFAKFIRSVKRPGGQGRAHAAILREAETEMESCVRGARRRVHE